MHFKTVRLTAIRNGSKRTISNSGGFGLLQMVLEPDTERCASEDAGPQGRWIVRSYIGWRREQNCNGPDLPLADIVLFGFSLSGFPSRV